MFSAKSLKKGPDSLVSMADERKDVRIVIYDNQTDILLGYRNGAMWEVGPEIFQKYPEDLRTIEETLMGNLVFLLNFTEDKKDLQWRIDVERFEDKGSDPHYGRVSASQATGLVARYLVERGQDGIFAYTSMKIPS